MASETKPGDGASAVVGLLGLAVAIGLTILLVHVFANAINAHDAGEFAQSKRIDMLDARIDALEQWQAANTVAIEEDADGE